MRTILNFVRGGADKSLARPGSNKLQRPNSGFIQHTPHEAQNTSQNVALTFASHSKKKKKSEDCPSNQVSAATMTSASDEKWRPFNCFSVQGTDGSPTGPDQGNRVGGQDIGSLGRPVSFGLQVPGESGHCPARTRPLADISAAFFLQTVLQLHQ